MGDIWTVMWKEWRELLFAYGSKRGNISMLISSGLFVGVLLPLQSGQLWLTSFLSIAVFSWLPTVLVAALVADSFAGERERHTLETLLASPLSDRAILLGKVAAVVSYAWAYTLAIMLLGLVTVNLSAGENGLLLYSAPVCAVALALESALLVASVGVLVSLRAASVRQAQQHLSIVLLVLTLTPSFGLTLLPAQAIPSLFSALKYSTTTQVFWRVLLALFFIDWGVLLLAMTRFKRTQLTLD